MACAAKSHPKSQSRTIHLITICRVGSYRSDDLNHEELVDELLRAPYKWLLSEYDHPVYARLGGPFWRKTMQLRSKCP
jgi:hypothetical protein